MSGRTVRPHQSILTSLAIAGLVLLQAQLLPAGSQPVASAPGKAQVDAQYANLPLAFEPNQGQADSSVDFLVHHSQAVTAFNGTSSTTSVGGRQITMSLDGANSASFTGQDELQSKTNYFLGNDQSQWHSDIPNFQKLIAKNVYAGIDLAYYGTNSTLEHDFIVSPGSDYHQIAFNFSGQDNLSQDKDGNLILKAGDDELRLNAPTTYQLGEHEKHTIPSKFELHDNTVTVAVASDYDPTKPLLIDPVLIYSTYLGGSGSDSGNAITVDASGNAYIVGETDSANFPTVSAIDGSRGGPQDAFIAKLNAAGTALVYSTYIGGSSYDAFFRAVPDISGNLYVCGYTYSSDFPTVSAYDSTYGGNGNGTVLKVNAAGSALTYSTYLGGADGAFNSASGIAIDSSGSAYVVGFTGQGDFPTTAGAFQTSGAFGNFNAYVTKFAPSGSSLVYSTYLGGSTGQDAADTIAVDSGGNAYVVGNTDSTNFPTASPYQAARAGGRDLFVTKLNATGTALVYSTYLGGTGNEETQMDWRGAGIAIDSSGNAYVGSVTASTNYPTASPYQAANAGGKDAVLTELNAAGSALVFSTYLGGSGDDVGYNLGLDQSNNIFLGGYTASSNFPSIAAYQSTYGGGTNDVFVAKFPAAGGTPSYSTYVGGNGNDFLEGVAVNLAGTVYLSGSTTSTNFPTLNPYQASSAGGADAFVTQLSDKTVNLTARVDPTLTFTVGSTTCALGTLSATQAQQCTYTLTAATNGTSGYSISYLPVATLTSGANTITALTSPTASTLNTEQFGINLAANTSTGSHTAANFGAAPSGGSGVASANYTTANSFKLATGGETIATATSPSLTTTYTISTIANITNTTEAGAYTTTFTYNIVSTY